MAGTADNTAIWLGADVYIAPEKTAGPTSVGSAWAAAWQPVGLLDGEDGITESREGDSTEHYAWGGILYRRTNSKHKRTFKFIALEDNAVTFGLVNPGSTRTTTSGTRTAKIKAPVAGTRFAVGFEVRDGAKVKRRFALSAEVIEVAEIKESETEPTVFEITVVVFPEADGTLYTVIENDPAVPATGATSGIPGSFTPAGSSIPANFAAMATIVASPATAWTTGQYVPLGDGSKAYWTGTAWAPGAKP